MADVSSSLLWQHNQRGAKRAYQIGGKSMQFVTIKVFEGIELFCDSRDFVVFCVGLNSAVCFRPACCIAVSSRFQLAIYVDYASEKMKNLESDTRIVWIDSTLEWATEDWRREERETWYVASTLTPS